MPCFFPFLRISGAFSGRDIRSSVQQGFAAAVSRTPTGAALRTSSGGLQQLKVESCWNSIIGAQSGFEQGLFAA
ncbi:hypothetical protein ACFLW6_03420 [Chloroflexota bacterium]